MVEYSEHTFDYERVIRSTDKALLIEADNGEEVWIPKSQILNHDEEEKQMTIPGWLAAEKGLAD